MSFLRYILMMFLLLLGFESQAARYALVIGNADYRAMTSLHNPAADAEDMAAALGNLKFQVTPLINASKREMDETLGNFYEQVKQQNAAHEVIVYFSGHGLQHEGANHLIPIDASLKQRADIPYMTVNAQQILDNLHEINSTGVNLLILDACRDVPNQLKSLVKGGDEGLVGMKPSGSLVLYATTPGKTTLSHPKWRNSIYTHYLLEALRDRTKQSLSIFDVQTVVAAAVAKKTQQQQFPWHEGTLTQTFCFLPSCGISQKDENLLSGNAKLKQQATVVTPVTEVPKNQNLDEEASFELGMDLWKQGKWAEAAAAFQKQIEITPNHESAWYNLGVALGHQGKLDEAVAAYRKQLEIEPSDDSVWYNLGWALDEQGKLDEAIAAYRKQLEIKPNHESAWNNLGIALEKQGKKQEAIAAYRKQLEIVPNNQIVQRNLNRFLKRK